MRLVADLRSGPGWGGVAHVFLGAALALPPLLLGWVFTTSLRAQGQSWLGRGSLLVLAAGTVVVVVLVALGPAVRPVEVAAARLLLRLDLPEPLAPRARESRVLGALWVGVCAAVGAVALLALLLLVPLGVGLAAYPLGSSDTLDGPGFAMHLDHGWGAAWLELPALACALGAVVALPVAGRLLRAWAPTFLSPLGADRVVESLRREREASERNLLARELHDSLGHALSAITVQAGAARSQGRTGQEVQTHLAAIEEVSRDALRELDDVLGLLRGSAGATPQRDLRQMVDLHRSTGGLTARLDEVDDLPPATRLALDRVVREGLANADRHGVAPRALTVRRLADCVQLDLVNALPDPDAEVRPSGARPGGGTGLVGMRDRVAGLGGTVEAGPADGPDEGGSWQLTVRLPTGEPR